MQFSYLALSEEEPKAVVVISASVFVVHFDKITNE
jgi:hypothetical protein